MISPRARRFPVCPATPGAMLLIALTVMSAALQAHAQPADAKTHLDDASVEPIPLGPNDAEARALMARGRWAAAAKKVTAAGPGPRFVKGWLLHQAGQHAAAARVLVGLAQSIPRLAHRITVLHAEALLASGAPQAALDRLAAQPRDDASPDPPSAALTRRAARVRARALRETGQRAEARRAYEQIIEAPDSRETPVGLLGLARLWADGKQPTRAIPLLRRIDSEFPVHWTARPAAELAGEIIKGHPKLRRAYERRAATERLARGEALLAAHRNRAAVKALTPLTKMRLKGASKCRQRYALGRALRKLRRWKRARPLIEQAVESCRAAKSPLYPKSLYLAAQAAERLSREVEAANHSRRLMEEHPDHRLGDDGGFFLVRHHLEDLDDLDGARALVTDLVERFPQGDMVGEAIFFVAMHALGAEQADAALEILALDDRLPPRDPLDHDAGRTLYWRGRLHLDAGRIEEARARFESVLATHPLGWYAILAYSRLRELDVGRAREIAQAALDSHGPGPSLPSAHRARWRFAIPPGLSRPALERATLLARLGLAGPAWRSLRASTGGEPTDDVLWLSAWLLDRAGAPAVSHNILRRQLKAYRRLAPSGNLRKHWEIAYPTPFEALVRENAKGTQIDPFLIWSIMREESGFSPKVESFANAIGLMQLILPTAKRMAKRSDRPVTRTRLTVPSLNVKLGARYLAHVSARASGLVPLIAAGYNAGAGAIVRWLKARGELPLDQFVEMIPFREARWYSKRVASSWATYRFLYSAHAPDGLEDPLPYLSQDIPAKAKADRR